LSYWVMAGILTAAVVLQTTILPYLQVAGVQPDLVLLLTVCLGLLNGPREGLRVGLVGGAILDIITGRYLGLHTLSLAAAGCLTGYYGKRVFRDNILVPFTAALAATVLQQTIVLVLLKVFSGSGGHMMMGTAYTGLILPLALYHAVVSPFLFGRLHFMKLQGKLGVPVHEP